MRGLLDRFNGQGEDIVYTPDYVAKEVVRVFRPKGRVLDPCSGDGVFLKYLPKGSDWCEIRKGRDFFEWKKPVDWIVSNPPYSIFRAFLSHAFTVSPNVVFLIPVIKMFNSFGIMRDVSRYGGTPLCYVMGTGKDMSFPQESYPIAAVHFQRKYTGGMRVEFYKGKQSED